jgi:ubiquinone/menaquinone biosynthesis C-methylase UbiE
MGINFHGQENKFSYAGREAQPDWADMMRQLVDPNGKIIVDLGCGGGIYSKAWVNLGAKRVIGVDFSEVMLKAAEETCIGIENITFRQGDALQTGLEDGTADILFARALIHHLADLPAFLAEAHRVLKPGGMIILQDRTPEDVRLPGSAEHIRGYFFSCYPHLLQVEERRRPDTERVRKDLAVSGFAEVNHLRFWETRKEYRSPAEVAEELLSRRGRSILHELRDDELKVLVEYIAGCLPGEGPITEKDRWTIWVGKRM